MEIGSGLVFKALLVELITRNRDYTADVGL